MSNRLGELLSRAKRSRLGLAAFWLLTLMAGWFVLRLVLFFQFRVPGQSSEAVMAMLSGFWRDMVAATWLTLPLLGWTLILPGRHFRATWHRSVFWTVCFVFWFGQTFILFTEYFFFEEFRSRFNTVAVDYLQYPKEVFVNIWDSYHVGFVLCACAVPAAAWVWAARRFFAPLWEGPTGDRPGLLRWAGAAALAGALTPLLLIGGSLAGIMHSPVHFGPAHISSERTLNEIANNGDIAFFEAAVTHNLDYHAFYRTMDRADAYRRARQLLNSADTTFQPGETIRRTVAGDPSKPRLNVIIFLEESLGSEFWGSLGRKEPTLTPEMDKLAAEEGLLFTNIYASGNRTVRGMEGVLSSFPPLPGESIVKRDLSDNVETLARVLKRDGYSTLFLYGGRGVFDGMRSFAVRNGYDRFIEQKHFEHPTFTTIWGVCDEDLYRRTLEECAGLSKQGKPFFATVLSVSNHKPYTYPKGKIAEDPEERRRENVVKYSDYALGQFFKAAKREPLWTNTIFVVVADHGARVYGQQSIPIYSYEIPLLIAGPAAASRPLRPGILGCSLDVGPTILGLIGRPYESLFFGQDLLKCPAESGRALLNHNRDIGLLKGDRMAVLGLMKSAEFYAGNPKQVEMKPMKEHTDTDRELLEDTTALYQVADDLYMHRRYTLDEAPLPAGPQAKK